MSKSHGATADHVSIPRSEERQHAAWAAVGSLALGVFGLVTAEFLPASLLTPIARDLAISEGTAGQTVTATAAIGAFAGLLVPLLTGRFDRRLVMWSLTATLIVSSLLSAFATGLVTLLGSRLLLGIGIGGFWSMAAATTMRLVPASVLPRAMSIIFAGVSIATVSAAPVGAYLGELIGWRAVFGLAALVGIVTLVAQMVLLPALPAKSAPGLGTLADLLRRPSIRLVIAAVLLVISGHFAGFTYIRVFLEQVPKLSVELVSLGLLAFGVGGFFGNFAGASLVTRGTRAPVIFGALLIAAAALVLIAFGASMPVAIATAGIWGFAFGAIPVGTQAWIVEAAPDETEAASGMIVAAFQVAIGSGAIFGGLALDHLGQLGAVSYAAVATLLGALLVLTARRK